MVTGEHERHGPYTTAGGLTVYWRGWALETLVSAHVAELSRDNCIPGGPLDRQCWACGERDRLARVLKGGPVIATNDRGDPALLLDEHGTTAMRLRIATDLLRQLLAVDRTYEQEASARAFVEMLDKTAKEER